MEIAVLGSGSSGNATVVRSGGTTILLEAGLSARQITLRARAAGFEPETISAVFVSHAHGDHVQGAPVFSRRNRIPVFMTDAAHEEWSRARSGRLRRAVRAGSPAAAEGGDAQARAGGRGEAARGTAAAAALGETLPLFGECAEPGLHERVPLEESGVVELGPLRVRSFPLPHDGSGTVGYVVEARGLRFGYVTDLGHVTALVVERLKGCDALLVEMNHDPDLLREGPYPWDVKQRIASRHGHLSNEQGATLLEQVLGPDTRSVTLGHLSETNNQPAIALAAARLVLDRAGRGGVRLAAAEPHRPTERLGL